MMGSGFGMGWMWLLWLLLTLGVILLVVVAVRTMGGGATRGSARRDVDGAPRGLSRARLLLDERYARGELTTQEYRERLQTLGEDT